MGSGVDIRAVGFVLSQINDGFIFETFAQRFLAQRLGYKFCPIGGIKDRGIDGLELTFGREGIDKFVYQVSIEKKPIDKISRTLDAIVKNKIECIKLYYVTNIEVKDIDHLADTFLESHGIPVTIYDAKWFIANINESDGTVNIYRTFVESYFHEFNQPGKSYEIANLEADPRLFVFLRQQWDKYRKDREIDILLADTLILFALEGTDPDKKILRTKSEIKDKISSQIGFEPSSIMSLIDERLRILSTRRPHRIKHHRSINAYCLPYETRCEIQDRNLTDRALYDQFSSSASNKLKKYLGEVNVKNAFPLLEATFNKLFMEQGLEFATFVTEGTNKEIVEKRLDEIIATVIDESAVIVKNKQAAKRALLITVREIVYDGTAEEIEFLQKLSSTYKMLFLLQCDPKLAIYFNSLAARQKIYLDNSILVPALSEYFLPLENRRYWNLLKSAQAVGTTLIVNEVIVSELVAHLSNLQRAYLARYEGLEKIYIDEYTVMYIDDMLIRAYFYARLHEKVNDFRDFFEVFLSWNLSNAKDEIIDWLKEEFGIQYLPSRVSNAVINDDEYQLLYQELCKRKNSPEQARSDAILALTIYGLRETANETNMGGIFGYNTWWLSIDTITERAVKKVFNERYEVSCFMRPDFLYNYVSLAPSKEQVSDTFSKLFPSLLGVNISFHIPNDISKVIHSYIKEHQNKNTSRLKSIIRQLSEKLRSDPNYWTREQVKHFLDEKRKELTK